MAKFTVMLEVEYDDSHRVTSDDVAADINHHLESFEDGKAIVKLAHPEKSWEQFEQEHPELYKDKDEDQYGLFGNWRG